MWLKIIEINVVTGKHATSEHRIYLRHFIYAINLTANK